MVTASRAPVMPHPSFDKDSATPLFVQVKYYFVHLISRGELAPGAALPSVRAFASAVGLAPVTVQRAYRELENEGAIIGEPGRGYFVTQRPAEGLGSAERQRHLTELLLPVVLQARTLGFTEAEILGELRRLLAGTPATRQSSRVVVVGKTRLLIDRYARQLGQHLREYGVEVTAVTEADLDAACTEADSAGRPVTLVVAHAESIGRAQAVANRYGLPVDGLTVDLVPSVKAALAALPRDNHVGLVTEAKYLPTALALIPQYGGSFENVSTASSVPGEQLRHVLATCDPIVHSMQAERIVRAHAPAGTRLIRLDYEPDARFLDRLRARFR